MRHLLIIIAIIAVNITTAKAQITPSVEFETGYKSFVSSFKDINQGAREVSLKNYPMYFRLNMGAKYKGFSILTDIENYTGYEKGSTSFTPAQIDYTIGLSYTYKRLSFNYSHMCSHPIVTTWMMFDDVFTMAYDKLTVKIKIL